MIAVAWLACLAAMTYRDWVNPQPIPVKGQQPVSSGRHLPYPSELLATFIVFGTLGVLEDTRAQPAATAAAWGFVLATLFSIWNPSAPLGLSRPGSIASTKPAGGVTV